MHSPPRHRIALAGLCAGLALLGAAPAWAGWFPGEVIDGPNPDLVSVGGVDVAPKDGTGGVVYVRRDGGVAHIFASRLIGGAWQPPERVDGGLAAAASAPVIAAGAGGRLAAAWLSGGTLYASVRPGAASGWTAPQPVGAPAEAPAIDMGLNGTAYVVWAAGGDVRAARLERGATRFAALPGALDLDPAHPAGDAPGRRPTVAVSADGVALAAWGELLPDGRSHVIARRLSSLGSSPEPQDLTLDQLDGRPGVDADQPDASISGDSSYGYVAFRESFVDGGAPVTRALARRMRGSLFEAPVAIDGQGFPAEGVGAPRIAETVGAFGLAVAGRASGQIYASTFSAEHFDRVLFSPALALASTPTPLAGRPVIALAEDRTGLVAWTSPDGQLRVRELAGDFRAELQVSRPELGTVDLNAGVVAAGDRYLDAAVVAIQDTGTERRLVAAMLDREPGSFSPASSARRYPEAPARVSWREPTNAWGRLTYTVIIDDRVVGRTRRTSFPLGRVRIGRGQHRYRIEARDVRGQVSSTPTRLIRIYAGGPRATRRITIR